MRAALSRLSSLARLASWPGPKRAECCSSLRLLTRKLRCQAPLPAANVPEPALELVPTRKPVRLWEATEDRGPRRGVQCGALCCGASVHRTQICSAALGAQRLLLSLLAVAADCGNARAQPHRGNRPHSTRAASQLAGPLRAGRRGAVRPTQRAGRRTQRLEERAAAARRAAPLPTSRSSRARFVLVGLFSPAANSRHLAGREVHHPPLPRAAAGRALRLRLRL